MRSFELSLPVGAEQIDPLVLRFCPCHLAVYLQGWLRVGDGKFHHTLTEVEGACLDCIVAGLEER